MKICGLGLVQELLELAEVAVGARLDLGARGDQAAQGGLLLHQPARSGHVLGGGHRVGERQQVPLAPLQPGQHAAHPQLVGDGDHVQRLPALVDRQHRLEDLAVRRQEEVVDLQRRGHLVEGGRLDEDRPQHRFLRVD